MVLSLSKIPAICALLFSVLLAPSQTIELPYSAAAMAWYSGNLYGYGLETAQNGKTSFVIQRFGKNFDKLTELHFLLQFQYTENKLSCWSDTLHGFLNIYVSEGPTQKVSLFRFGRNFELLNQSSGLEVSRLNVLSGFDNELYYENANAYVIKTKGDSAGKQFFLNKYTFKNTIGGFEYDLIWQFPFERRNVASARVFFANKDAVYMYVVVKAGEKKGQWMLKVSAKNGHLLKGSKLNEKGDENTYCFGNYYYESTTKSMLVCGHKFHPKQLNPGTEVLSIAGSTAVVLYLVELDSLGEQVLKQEIRLPVTASKPPVKTAFLLQINKFTKTAGQHYQLEADVYQSNSTSSCYTYANSFALALSREEENFLAEKKAIFADPLITTYLGSNDRLDMNGKICLDSTTTLNKLLYKRPSLPVKLAYSTDSVSRPLWILSKSNPRKGAINFSLLLVEKKSYVLKSLEDLAKSSEPQCISIPGKQLVIGRQTETGTYKIRVYRY